jgi:hypothetical protein
MPRQKTASVNIAAAERGRIFTVFIGKVNAHQRLVPQINAVKAFVQNIAASGLLHYIKHIMKAKTILVFAF